MVNATTGEAVPGAKVSMKFAKDTAKDIQLESHYECDTNGEVIIDFGDREPESYSISTADEPAFPVTPINDRFYYRKRSSERVTPQPSSTPTAVYIALVRPYT